MYHAHLSAVKYNLFTVSNQNANFVNCIRRKMESSDHGTYPPPLYNVIQVDHVHFNALKLVGVSVDRGALFTKFA